MSKNAVVFIGMTFPHGITRHFAYLGIAINKWLQLDREIDCYYAATDGETGQNAWPMVEGAFAGEFIIKTGTFVELTKRVKSLFNKYNCVLVHSGGGRGQVEHFKHLKREFGKRFQHVVTTHSYRHDSTLLRIPMSMFQYFLYSKYADMVVFQCPYAARRFVGGERLLASGKGCVIPLGCEEFQTLSPNDPLVFKGKPWLSDFTDDSIIKFVYLAGFRPGKKHLWLVNAVAPLLKDNPRVRVFFCGRLGGDVARKVQKRIVDLGMGRQIICTDQVPRADVPWVLQHSNVALVPSSAETFGHNYIEPMFAGLPVLGTRTGAGEYAIQDYRTGLGFSLSDERSFRLAFKYFLENPEKSRMMGEYAMELAKKEFSQSSVAAGLVRMYKHLISRTENEVFS